MDQNTDSQMFIQLNMGSKLIYQNNTATHTNLTLVKSINSNVCLENSNFSKIYMQQVIDLIDIDQSTF
jgi:hypothetical protein